MLLKEMYKEEKSEAKHTKNKHKKNLTYIQFSISKSVRFYYVPKVNYSLNDEKHYHYVASN